MERTYGDWGFKKYQSIDHVQHIVIQIFLAVNKFKPKLAMVGDVKWLPSNY
ncbi:hypothetical protein DPMN_040230 [Dreissena polymorpha]|uniref:Uncharacterized protein n=1 Tax=Dreissena polymorpha TaxID=45954 RepID=A0A9D4HSV3_DREPO|nr:hypothetical protein DPMN_040230 [Dreissena polymorpha]